MVLILQSDKIKVAKMQLFALKHIIVMIHPFFRVMDLQIAAGGALQGD